MKTKIKVCGLTRVQDALLAAELGATAVGFIFYPKSPRYVTAQAVRAIVDALPSGVEKIGVFVNPAPDELVATARVAGLTRVQLHGDESPGLCQEAGLPVVKALRLSGAKSASHAPADPATLAKSFRAPVVGFLIDADAAPGVWGGTGERADWMLAQKFVASESLRTPRRELWLAGGITPENAAQAIRAVGPDGVDVSSGVESAPGIKDRVKLRALFAAVAGAEKERA